MPDPTVPPSTSTDVQPNPSSTPPPTPDSAAEQESASAEGQPPASEAPAGPVSWTCPPLPRDLVGNLKILHNAGTPDSPDLQTFVAEAGKSYTLNPEEVTEVEFRLNRYLERTKE